VRLYQIFLDLLNPSTSPHILLNNIKHIITKSEAIVMKNNKLFSPHLLFAIEKINEIYNDIKTKLEKKCLKAVLVGFRLLTYEQFFTLIVILIGALKST